MMLKQSKLTATLEKIFWFYLYLNPVLDILNGFYISLVSNVHVLDVEFISTLGITPSLVIRLVFLAVFACYLIVSHDWKSIITAGVIALAWLLSMASEYLNSGHISFFIDAQYMARFCYNIAVLMVFSRVFAQRWTYDGKDLTAQLSAVIHYTLILLSLAVLIPAILRIGYSTYADIRGYRGNRGFFYAGNDITAILTVLLPITIAAEMRSAKTAKEMSGRARFGIVPALAAGLAANALMVIGSKTAFIALILSFLVMLVVAVVYSSREHSREPVNGFLFVVLFTVVISLIINLISVLQNLPEILQEYGRITLRGIYSSSMFSTVMSSMVATEDIFLVEDIGTGLFNGRLLKLADQFAQYRAGGFLVWLFGLGRGSQEVVIEMDVFEVLCYYGIFGLAAMLWLYVRLAVDFLRCFFRRVCVRSIAIFLGIGMTIGYMVIAGHILFSVTSGFYLSFAILFSRVFFAEKSEEILLWKQRSAS